MSSICEAGSKRVPYRKSGLNSTNCAQVVFAADTYGAICGSTCAFADTAKPRQPNTKTQTAAMRLRMFDSRDYEAGFSRSYYPISHRVDNTFVTQSHRSRRHHSVGCKTVDFCPW